MKATLIKIAVIKPIKSLLDFGLHKQMNNDAALNASIDRAISESQKGLSRPYEDFIADVRKRYNLSDTVKAVKS